MAHLRRQVMSRRTMMRGALGAAAGSLLLGAGNWSDQTFETVDWSQARYADYGFIALDVTPAARGHRTTMVLRFINEQGRELDRVVFSRTAGDVLQEGSGQVPVGNPSPAATDSGSAQPTIHSS
jgi:hypothetical protein